MEYLRKENFTLASMPTSAIKAKYGIECYVTSTGDVYKQITAPIGSKWVYLATRELKTSDIVETTTKKYDQTSNKNISDADLGVDPETGQPFLQDLFTEEQIFDNDGTKSYKVTIDKKGRIKSISQVTVSGGSGYTDEQAQDAVGTILDNTSDVEFTYDDVTPKIIGAVKKVDGVTPSATGKIILAISDLDALITLMGLISTDITDSTAIGRQILTAANDAAVKSLLSLVSTDISDSTSIGRSVLTGASASAIRALLSAQLTDADLDAIAALTPSNDDFIQRKAGAWTNRTIANVQDDVSTSYFSYRRSGKWYTQARNITAFGTSATINNTSSVTMSELEISRTTVITDIAVEVTTALAGASLYFGIYKIDYPTWTTGALVLSASGVSAATTGVKSVTLGSPISLLPGKYMIAVSHNGAGSVTFRSIGIGATPPIGAVIPSSLSNMGIYIAARASGGALPANLSGYTSFTETTNSVPPVFWFKVQ